VSLYIDYLENHRYAISQLAELHHAEWLSVTPTLSVADRMAGFEARARRGSIPTGFVAIDDEAVVGMACLVDCDLESHRHLTPWLATVLVAPACRRRGVGAALVGRAADEALQLGVSELFLFTFDRQAFYSRLGWQLLEAAADAGRAGTIMSRRLTRVSSDARNRDRRHGRECGLAQG
jgi:N-acetylglutamate synthase-like GNAT family acetyltransferase